MKKMHTATPTKTVDMSKINLQVQNMFQEPSYQTTAEKRSERGLHVSSQRRAKDIASRLSQILPEFNQLTGEMASIIKTLKQQKKQRIQSRLEKQFSSAFDNAVKCGIVRKGGVRKVSADKIKKFSSVGVKKVKNASKGADSKNRLVKHSI